MTCARLAQRVTAVFGTLLATASAPALAAWECTDAFGSRYIVARPFGDSADVRCAPIDDAAPGASLEGEPVPERASAEPTSGNGLLVLVAPLRSSTWQLAARRFNWMAAHTASAPAATAAPPKRLFSCS